MQSNSLAGHWQGDDGGGHMNNHWKCENPIQVQPLYRLPKYRGMYRHEHSKHWI
jgi:hypothetical protein